MGFSLCWNEYSEILLSRDVRARRRNDDWLIHLRADSPAQYALACSNKAFEFLISFCEAKSIYRDQTSNNLNGLLSLAQTLIEPGFIIPLTFHLNNEQISISTEEVSTLRDRTPIEALGLLEMESICTHIISRELSKIGEVVCLSKERSAPLISLALGITKQQNKHIFSIVKDQESNTSNIHSPLLFEFYKNIEEANVENVIQETHLNNLNDAIEDEGAISLLFMDSDYSLRGMKKDLSAWLPRVMYGGFILAHQYGNPNWPGISAAFKELDPQLELLTVIQTMAIFRKK